MGGCIGLFGVHEMAEISAVKFEPVYKERIWGGRSLERLFGRNLPENRTIGESWDLADLPEGESRVADGPLTGRTLNELMAEFGDALLGSAEPEAGRFPLLIKFLDANDVLSVQVHPDYRLAQRLGGDVRAKYEAWYVISADKDACVYRGFKAGVGPHDVERAVAEQKLAELMVRHPAKVGDWFYLPGGTVHALGAGLVVAEVQTPSDTTFRLYDWNRVDPKTGQGRTLHVQQALDALNFTDPSADARANVGHVAPDAEARLASAPTFDLAKRFKPARASGMIETQTTAVWVVTGGAGRIGNDRHRVAFQAGDVVMIPAGLRRADYEISDGCSYLEVILREKR